MARYAVVQAGLVRNVVEWDGVPRSEVRVNDQLVGFVGWDPPAGAAAVLDSDGRAQIGGGYENGEFTPAPQPEPD